MAHLEPLLVDVSKFVGISFLLLAFAVVLLRWVRQPVERISLIQITLIGILAVLLMSPMTWLPKFELGVLPVKAISDVKIDQGSDFQTSTPKAGSGAVQNSEHGSIPQLVRQPSGRQVAKRTTETGGGANEGNEGIHSDSIAGEGRITATPAPVWNGAVLRGTLVLAMLVISLGQLLHVVLGYVVTKRLIARARRLPEKIEFRVRNHLRDVIGGSSEPIRLRVSDRIQVPMVHGLFCPTILLPDWQLDSKVSDLSLMHCLAHEWKHLERRDLLTWTFVTWLQPLLWMQPFYWMLRRELRISQDQIADEFAAQATDQHAEYASTLLELAKTNYPSLLGALTMAGTKSNLYRRVEMLLNRKFQLSLFSRRRMVASFVALIAIGSISMASLQLVQAEAGLSDSLTASNEPAEKNREQDQDNAAKESPKEATESVEHSGVVRDAVTKKPLKGAVVTVRRSRYKGQSNKIIEETQHVTDANGVYRFSIPPKQLNVPALYIELDVRHDDYASKNGFGYAYSMIRKNEELGEPPFFAEVSLNPAAAVTGRVVDAEGNPLVGVEVSGYSQPASDGSSFVRGSFEETRTGENGHFKINFAREGDSILWVKPKDHAMKQLMTGIKRGDIGEIVVDKGIRVFGQVLDARGNPVAGAWVGIDDVMAQQEIQIPVATSMRRVARTDEKGMYETEPVAASTFKLRVSDRGRTINENGYEEWISTALPGVFVDERFDVSEENASESHDIQAVPHVFVRGQFVNSKNEPTSGHMPHLFGKVNGSYIVIQAKKGENKGEFFAMVPHGMEDVQVSFTTNEHSAIKIKCDDEPYSVGRRFNIGTVEEDFDTFKIMRYVAPILQVQVVDEAGNQLDQARVGAVYANATNQEIHMLVDGTQTSILFEKQKDGFHRSYSICPEMEFECFAELDGYQRASKTITMEENKSEKLTLTLKKLATEATKKD